MAQLPPKVPTMTPTWSDFPHQIMASPENLPSNTTVHRHHHQNPSWMDEFLDFSTAKRGSHRRSISDSIAFVEHPILVEECGRRSSVPGSRANNEFDRFDDEQLMSMFADEITVAPTISSSNTSSPSDHNSVNDEKSAPLDHHRHHHHHHHQQQQQKKMKNESEEVQSPCESEAQVTTTNGITEISTDKIIDPKRVRRILANRLSAQRSRVRKLQYISELERSVNSLQAEVSVLSPRVAFLDHQRLALNVDNSALKQRIAALAQDKIFKDAHQEALRREIERLRKVYEEQNLEKMENGTTNGAHPPSSDANGSTKNEQLLN